MLNSTVCFFIKSPVLSFIFILRFLIWKFINFETAQVLPFSNTFTKLNHNDIIKFLGITKSLNINLVEISECCCCCLIQPLLFTEKENLLSLRYQFSECAPWGQQHHNYLETNSWPRSKPNILQTLGPGNLWFNKHFGCFWCTWSLRMSILVFVLPASYSPLVVFHCVFLIGMLDSVLGSLGLEEKCLSTRLLHPGAKLHEETASGNNEVCVQAVGPDDRIRSWRLQSTAGPWMGISAPPL